MKAFIRFAAKVTLVQAVTYIGAGMIAYPLWTHQFLEGPHPLLAPLVRLPSEPELWAHVLRWMLPAQLFRGILLGAVLYPLLDTYRSWSFAKRFLNIAAMYIIIGQWASPVAGAHTVEGWLILRPEFTTLPVVLRVIPEGLIQGLALGAWLARWLSTAAYPTKNQPKQALQPTTTAITPAASHPSRQP